MDPHAINDTVLVLDFGGQTSYLITKRIREAGVYCELLPCTTAAKDVPFKPIGIILSGGPASVYADDAPHIDHTFFDLGVPILGICYGLQEMAWHFKGKVQPGEHREYGHADLEVMQHAPSALFADLPDSFVIWMSHGDQVEALPPGFQCIAKTNTAPLAAIEWQERSFFGVQFHPEVTHTPLGGKLFANFALTICKAKPSWKMSSFIDVEIERIRQLVGPEDQVIGAVSGGVDSTVAACLLKEAIGSRFHAILVDNGLMRLNECEEVKQQLADHLGINLTIAQAADTFMSRLKGVTDPEQKRKIIGNTFINVFESEAARIEASVEQEGKGKIKYLLQGTLYPDVIESISYKGPSATIKTHHNVGGLLKDMKLKLIEPLRECFKDEVRALGALMKIDENLLWRHPFPGPGLGIRILGEVTPDQVRIARQADHIYITEIKKAGLYREISQAYAGVLPIKTVGVMGDARTWQQAIALRAVCSKDFMTADCYPMPWDVMRKICNRIINEVDGVNRVFYDTSSKPPSTIELE